MKLRITRDSRVLRAGAISLLALVIAQVMTSAAFSQAGQGKGQDKPYVVEYYYKARWGFADEFIRLFKKNHYPLLKKQVELGRILQVSAVGPRYHATEDGRWDYRVTISWKNAQVAFDDFNSEGLARELYPDQESFKREEARRFEILIGHWDVPITTVDLEGR